MTHAMLEYLAEKNARPAWAAGQGNEARREVPIRAASMSLSDRILRWWLRRSKWRMVRLRV